MTNSNNSNYHLSSSLSLGQNVEYKDVYSAELLQGVPRALSREQIGLAGTLPFTGVDIWNGYEVSWLNLKGKPQVAILRCYVDITSENLIESKSFKLYLNSFNQSKFESWRAVETTMTHDLSQTAGGKVELELLALDKFTDEPIAKPQGQSIDDLDININCYSPNPNFLTTEATKASENLYSNLLKSNCLITSQPDWASISINYSGNKINREGLLRYIVSYRQHNEFHEQCIERIYCDILARCQPDKLTVYARYTRRGGLDINPFRSNFENPLGNARLPRQ